MKISTFGSAAVVTLAAAGPLAGVAAADVVINLDEATWDGGRFTMFFSPGQLAGTLTSISLSDFTCTSGPQGQTFTVYFVEGPLPPDAATVPFLPASGGRLQVGGSGGPQDPLDLGAVEWGFWAGPSNPGFLMDQTYTVAGGGFDISSYAVLFGNGMEPTNNQANSNPRTYTGTITLHGVTDVLPTPGAIALLGISGLVGTSRRRR